VDSDDESKKVRAVSAAEGTAAASEALREAKRDDDPLVGATLDGRYTILRKLGHGGMGVVYAARHAVIERPLAIKVLRREAMRDEATIRRFVQEAKAASRVNSPHIVDVTDFGTTPDGLTYSVMELVDGTTLAKTIKASAPFPPERAIRIASQIARALGAAHDKGIVHRDLKPENVFLIERDGRPDFVKIVDFGIAKVQPLEGTPEGPKLTRAGSVFGTAEYMAPEQAAGRGQTDHRVDIYALGTILYQMLVGKVPIKGANMVQTIAMQLMETIPRPSAKYPDLAIPPAVEDVVMRAVAKNRDERFSTMGELATALEAAALAPTEPPRRHRPATKPPREPSSVAAPLAISHVEDTAQVRVRRPLWPYALLALAVLSAGVAVAVVILHSQKAEPVATVERRDAAVVALMPDAAAVAVAPPDAAIIAVTPPRDAGVREVRPAAVTTVPSHPATVTIEVLTEPGDAEVYIDGHQRGPSGVHLEEPYGHKVTVECRGPHLLGRKTVVFDGKVSAVYCTASRIPMCVEGLKNPYDVCEEPEGSAAGPVTSPTP
jgi:serine/threonine-protein kinase